MRHATFRIIIIIIIGIVCFWLSHVCTMCVCVSVCLMCARTENLSLPVATKTSLKRTCGTSARVYYGTQLVYLVQYIAAIAHLTILVRLCCAAVVFQ